MSVAYQQAECAVVVETSPSQWNDRAVIVVKCQREPESRRAPLQVQDGKLARAEMFYFDTPAWVEFLARAGRAT
jgi:hypothetical protein